MASSLQALHQLDSSLDDFDDFESIASEENEIRRGLRASADDEVLSMSNAEVKDSTSIGAFNTTIRSNDHNSGSFAAKPSALRKSFSDISMPHDEKELSVLRKYSSDMDISDDDDVIQGVSAKKSALSESLVDDAAQNDVREPVSKRPKNGSSNKEPLAYVSVANEYATSCARSLPTSTAEVESCDKVAGSGEVLPAATLEFHEKELRTMSRY